MKNVGGYYSRVHFLSNSYDYIVNSREFFKQNHSQSEPRNGMEVCVGFCIDSAHYRVCRCSINSLFSIWIGKKLVILHIRETKYCLERENIVKMIKERICTIETLRQPQIYNMHQ